MIQSIVYKHITVNSSTKQTTK